MAPIAQTTVSADNLASACLAYLAPQPSALWRISSSAEKLSNLLAAFVFHVIEISFSSVAFADLSTCAAMSQLESLPSACHCTCCVQSWPSHSTMMLRKVTSPSGG